MLNREEIIKDVEKNKIIVILRGFDKEQLINTVAAMEKGDVLLLAGKGTQKDQLIGGRRVPFCEREIVAEALASMSNEER